MAINTLENLILELVEYSKAVDKFVEASSEMLSELKNGSPSELDIETFEEAYNRFVKQVKVHIDDSIK